jgi:hypothetical protein
MIARSTKSFKTLLDLVRGNMGLMEAVKISIRTAVYASILRGVVDSASRFATS